MQQLMSITVMNQNNVVTKPKCILTTIKSITLHTAIFINVVFESVFLSKELRFILHFHTIQELKF